MVAVITGGGSGTGRATAERFAQAGALVMPGDVADATMIDALYVPIDVSGEEDVAALTQTAAATSGQIDICINNAGITVDEVAIAQTSLESMQRSFAVNTSEEAAIVRRAAPLGMIDAMLPAANRQRPEGCGSGGHAGYRTVMPPTVITLPLRVGFKVTRVTLVFSAKLAVRVAGEVILVAQSRFGTTQTAPDSAADAPDPEAAPAPESAPEPEAAAEPESAPGTGGEPQAAVDLAVDVVSPIEEFPDTPLTREEADAKTIDDRDPIVAEFAEPGAEDGAGAQIDLGEPWDGYEGANAEVVLARLSDADAAELAVVELYEQSHKARKTVLEAASRRLTELSPPDAA